MPLIQEWLNYPEPGTPLTRDGQPDLAAKTPRAPHGKPDLSGVWQIEPPAPGEIERLYGKADVSAVAGDDGREFSRYFANLFIDFKPGEAPITPEAAAEALRNRDSRNRRYFDGVFRQIHTDGRKLPMDPFPSWMGYSTGLWDGDTLVVDTVGFNDKTWLDAVGHPHSEALRVRERFHRRDFGHLDIEATLEEAKTLTKPLTVRFTVLLFPNSDVLESFCAEGEKDRAYVGGAVR